MENRYLCFDVNPQSEYKISQKPIKAYQITFDHFNIGKFFIARHEASSFHVVS